VALLALGVGLGMVFGGGSGGAGGVPLMPPAASEGLPVSILKVAIEDDYRATRRHVGRLVAKRESQLGFDRAGRLASLSADLGDRVRAGTVVASLDTRPLDQRQAELEAARIGAQSSVAELEARVDLADITARRKGALVAQSAVTRQAYDDARLDAKALAASLAGARSEVARLDAQLAALAVERDLSRLTVPYDAIVTARMLDEGAAVQPGQAVLAIREAGEPEARVGLPRDDAQTLAEGKEVTLWAGSTALTGTVRRVVPMVNAETRTQAVVVDLAPGSAGVPGQVVHLETERRVPERGFWLPLDALTEGREGLWAAYAVVPGEGEAPAHVERREVEVIHAEENRVFVRGDLREGEAVVAQGSQRLVPGQAVRVTRTVVQSEDGALEIIGEAGQ
jgi:RND family efflux transporter MFP subunit